MAYNIYLYDNHLVSDELENDSGRTKAIRDILCNIGNNNAHYDDRSNVGKDVFIEPLICNLSNSNVTYINEICNACNYSDYKTPIEPFILFIHTSNKCFYRFIDQFLTSNVNCWIVCYSGADCADAFNYIKAKHPSKQNIRFFPHITPGITSETLAGKWDINAFVQAVIDQEENPFDRLVVRKGTPYLIALSILCQGYLATHEYNEIYTKLPVDLQGIVKKKNNLTESNEWWSVVDVDLIENELKLKEEKESKNWSNTDMLDIRRLLTAIKNSGIENQEIVIKAHRAIPKVLKI